MRVFWGMTPGDFPDDGFINRKGAFHRVPNFWRNMGTRWNASLPALRLPKLAADEDARTPSTMLLFFGEVVFLHCHQAFFQQQQGSA